VYSAVATRAASAGSDRADRAAGPPGAGAEPVASATVAPRRKQRYGQSMSTLLATAVNNNRTNLRANNRARPMRDCDQG